MGGGASGVHPLQLACCASAMVAVRRVVVYEGAVVELVEVVSQLQPGLVPEFGGGDAGATADLCVCPCCTP